MRLLQGYTKQTNFCFNNLSSYDHLGVLTSITFEYCNYTKQASILSTPSSTLDVSSLSTGLSPDQQQAFVKKIDDILLGQADREKTLPSELTEVQTSMQESMQASLSKMVITPQEALCWFKRASSSINTVTPWMSKERQETESIRQGVDAFAAYTKVSSMMATYSAADKHLIDSLRQNMDKFQHTWTDERAATFKRSVLQASWLRITAERSQKERYDLLGRNLGLS